MNMHDFMNKARSLTLHQFLTILAIFGILSAFFMIIVDQQRPPTAQPITEPSISPFKHFISGSGILEASSENISIGSQVNGTVKTIFVAKGQSIKQGEPLFELDSRAAKADVQLKTAQVATAKTALEQSKVTLKNAQDAFNLINQVKDKRAFTKEEFIIRENNVLSGKAAVNNAEANVVAAQAQLYASQVNLQFLTITSPIDGNVLQVNMRVGEFVPANIVTKPLMLIGTTTQYHARVNIDENDAWRFDKNAPAVLFLRGNPKFSSPLKFEYVEPYVVPKQTLTGDATERVDTRVFQVIYSYDPKDIPAYLGQQVDVYIEAKPLTEDIRYGGPMEISR